jgi:hypothetical protein
MEVKVTWTCYVQEEYSAMIEIPDSELTEYVKDGLTVENLIADNSGDYLADLESADNRTCIAVENRDVDLVEIIEESKE